MTKIHNIVIAAASLASALATGGTDLLADDNVSIGTMKPHHALTFSIGSKRAVSYFLAEGKTCQLVLTIAEEPNLLEHSRFLATRFEADVPRGEKTRYSEGGQAFDFSCDASARAMSVTMAGTITLGSNAK